MARILSSGEWYEQLSSASLYESEFEQIVVEQSKWIFPDYHMVKFKAVVCSEDGSAKPDLALIDKEYREWWVLELEMGHHSLQTHILPQVRTLRGAFYGDKEAEYLLKANPLLSSSRLRDMMKGEQPGVLVLLNTPQPSWKPLLAKEGALLAVFEIFRSNTNRHIFRLNGDRPTPDIDMVSRCHLDPVLPGFLAIESPGGLGIPLGGKVNIYFNDLITEWKRVDCQNKVWLSPLGRNPLMRNRRYIISRMPDGRLILQVQN